MANPLFDHLRERSQAAFRQLQRSLDGITAEQAQTRMRADWRRYRWGIGLDGSIQGIVNHTAVWKHLFVCALNAGAADEGDAGPLPDNWPQALAWLVDRHNGMWERVRGLPPDGLERTVTLGGMDLSIVSWLDILYEHDVYHTGQISLVRQLQGHELADDH